MAEKRGLTVGELREKMSEHEFKHWLALNCMRIIGYEAEPLKIARLERRIAMSMSSGASKNLASYYNDPFEYTDSEDTEFQEFKQTEELSLEQRAANGEFDTDKMREFAKKHSEEKAKERLKNGNDT